MYSLIVTADDKAWQGEPYLLSRGRVFEYTEDEVVARFKELNEEQLARLYQLPTVFAFEKGLGQNALLGRVVRVRIQNRAVRIEYKLDGDAPISHDLLLQHADMLDIADWELNRTHWAVKDVDLLPFLEASGLAPADAGQPAEALGPALEDLPAAESFAVYPAVFRLPVEPMDATLVAIMMPFQPQFDGMLAAVSEVCEEEGLVCKNASQIWDNEEIIQDIFSLIYRSKMVICDFSGQNANVFYEAGIAHTLGKPVIPMAQTVEDLPFDLRHHRAAVYVNNPAGLKALQETLRPRLRRLVAAD